MFRKILLFTNILLIISIIGCERQPTEIVSSTSTLSSQNLIPITLRINCWTGYVESFKDDFIKYMRQQGYSVTVQQTKTNGLETFLRVLRNNEADLISPANDLYPAFVEEGLVQEITPELISNYSEINPVIVNKLGSKALRYGVPYTFGPYALGYNKNKMKAPSSYRVLWQDDYKGQISISEYDTANIYMTALMLGIPSEHLFNLSEQQLDEITQELRKLHIKQQPIYWSDNLDPKLAHQLSVATDWGVGVRQINHAGVGKWDLVIPNEGATAWVDLWMINSRIQDEKLKVAYAFIDFSLRAASQAGVARQTSYGVTNVYVGRHLTPAEVVEHHLTDPNYLNQLTLWKPLSQQVLKRYQDAWKKVIKKG